MFFHPESRYRDHNAPFHWQERCRKSIGAAGAPSLQVCTGSAAITLFSVIIFGIKVAVTGPAESQPRVTGEPGHRRGPGPPLHRQGPPWYRSQVVEHLVVQHRRETDFGPLKLLVSRDPGPQLCILRTWYTINPPGGCLYCNFRPSQIRDCPNPGPLSLSLGIDRLIVS